MRIAKYVKMVCWTSCYANVALGRCCSVCLVGWLRSFGGGCQSHHFKGPTRYIPTKATILYVIWVQYQLCYYPWTAVCLNWRFEQKPATGTAWPPLISVVSTMTKTCTKIVPYKRLIYPAGQHILGWSQNGWWRTATFSGLGRCRRRTLARHNRACQLKSCWVHLSQ